MSISVLALDGIWRDYWGMWNALVEPQIAPIERSKCHAPRLVLLPEVSQQVIPAGGKIQYNFRLPGGSIIYGLFAPKPEAPLLAGEITDYAVQITDIALGHEFFQEPIRVSLLFTPVVSPTAEGQMPAYTLLPTPHPVVADGLFSFEAWGTPGEVVVIVLLAAEVTDCQVR